MNGLKFSDETLKRIEKLQARYPRREASLIPVLHMANREFGHLSDAAYGLVSEITGVPKSKVYSVATFYTMFNQKPVGKFHIQVCKNVPCMLLGADDLICHISKKLGVAVGETTPDGLFTLTAVECLGACDGAPAMMVNEDYHTGLTAESVDAIIARCSAEAD